MVDESVAAPVIPTGFDRPVGATLAAAVRRLVAALQPERVILFGSYAGGTPTEDSDVDLLVVVETTAPPVERFAAASQALWPRPFPIDLLVLTPAEARRALTTGDPFITDILRRGRVLYERPG